VKLCVKVFDFCLQSSIWVAIAVSALVVITCVNLDLALPEFLVWFIFLGTIFGYNFIKYFEKPQLSALHLKKGIVNFKTIQERFCKLKFYEKGTFLLSVFCAIICCVLVFKLNKMTVLLLIIPALLSFFYAVSLGRQNLRSTSGLKIYVVGIVWALVTVVLPVVETKFTINYDVCVIFIQRAIFVVVLILPFEIRDLNIDDKSLKTLPQKYGIIKTKFLGCVFLLLILALEFLKVDLSERNVVALLAVFVITLFFLLNSSVRQSKYYASFLVEGIPVVWLLLVL
jgi:4-hydroxybenzoate polyprenyltransferase